MRIRMVKPETTRLELPGGDWLIVKKRLNAGEQREIFARMVVKMQIGEKTELNPRQVGIAQMVQYLIDWSVCDDDGQPIVIRDQPPELVGAILEQLEADDFNTIFEAITAHEARMTAERAEEKKRPAGATVM